jgi:hypothetical protein
MTSTGEPMEFITALQENMLSQDIVFSIQHPDEKIRDKAKIKAFESISKLKKAGIDEAMIFYLLCTSVTMLYATGQLSLLTHRALMTEYISHIYDTPDVPANLAHVDKIMRQMIVHMAVVKAKASPQAQTIINQVKGVFDTRQNHT